LSYYYRVIHDKLNRYRGRRGHDRVVIRFTTTYAISAYHHWCCEFEYRSGELCNIIW